MLKALGKYEKWNADSSGGQLRLNLVWCGKTRYDESGNDNGQTSEL